MRVEAGGRTFEGRAVDLGGVAEPDAVLAAIRGQSVDGVAVACPAPGPVHEHAGHLREGMSIRLRGALAAAARSRGEAAPQREQIEALRTDLDALSVPDADLDAVRRRLADAGESEARLRERVATLRGRVQALAEAGAEGEVEAARADLEAAVRALTEAETERIAAEQLHDRLEREAREHRDRRERRLELRDRVANLERAARADLVRAAYDRFRAAVGTLPGDATAGDGPGAYEGDAVTAALAVARIAAVDAPLVVATDRLGDAEAAARRLDAPVVRP